MTDSWRSFPMLLVATSLAAPQLSTAQTSWTGASGANWSAPGSWSNGVPTAGVTTVINGPSAVQLTDPGQATGTLTIGNSGTGSLAISSNGGLTSTAAFLGSPTSSRGTVTVSGSSASWDVSNALAIGGNATTAGGFGLLSISNGATVEIGGTLKLWSGGTLTLDGGNVTTQSFDRSVGTFNFQGGMLTVSGGTFTNSVAADGYLVVDSNASNKTSTLVLDALQNSPDYSGAIFVGQAENRNGALTLSGGTVITTEGIIVGRFAGATGKLVLDGEDTSLTNGSGSDIGRSGQGTLEIKNGATLTEGAAAYIGSDAGSSGVATISGAGSLWNNASYIVRVGGSGTGVLNVLNGGQMTSFETRISESAGSTGTVTVDGAGSTWTNSGAILIGAGGTLNVTNTGKVNSGGATIRGSATVDGVGSVWANSGVMTVANTGTGNLTIQNGGTSTNTRAYLGLNSDSLGTVTVSGTGSTWTNTEALYVGNSGRGIMNVREGGAASSVNAFVGYNSNFAMSEVNVDGAGSTWANTNTLYVGYAAGSKLNITNGGQVTTDYAYVGYQGAYKESIVTIDGAGSKLTVNGDLYNAYGFTGYINVTNGGSLVVGNTLSNYNPSITLDASGVIILDGGTITTKSFEVGAFGGTFIHNDGTLTVDGGTFGYQLNDPFVIEGGGSTKTATIVLNNLAHTPTFFEIYLGYSSDQHGALTIFGATQVISNHGVYLGLSSGSSGDLVVTGSGSALFAEDLAIGGGSFGPAGAGHLTITDGGKITATAGATIWEQGTLDGDLGAFVGDLVNHGTIAPGEEDGSVGTLTIDGGLSLTATGRIVMDIQSTIEGTGYDQLIVTGNLDLDGGSLNFNFASYSGDPLGQIFVIFPDQTLAGQTFSYSWTGLDAGYAVDVTTYAGIGAITVIAVPEPGAMALLPFAGLFLVTCYRRRRC